MTQFIARAPAPIRHLILLLLAAGLTYGTEQLPNVTLNPQLKPLLALILAALLAWVTPLIQSYGLGQEKADATYLDDFAEQTDNGSRPEDGPGDPTQDPASEFPEEIPNA